MEEKKVERNIYRANFRGTPFNLECDSTTVFQDSRGLYLVNRTEQGELPKIAVYSNNIPGAYELALLSVWDWGTDIATHYDKPGDAPSKEATVMVNIANPFNEPRIHKNFPGGPAELEVYRQEVVDGIHDHWIDPMAGKWTYTYHERLFNYNPSRNLKSTDRGLLLPKGVNQIELIVDDLQRDITSKGAQATTWMPSADPGLESNRPCMQRLWFRVLEDKNQELKMNMNCYFRSRDLYKAWFMNVYALTSLQKKVAEMVSDRLKKEVRVNGYTDTSDSLHIYGAYFKEFEQHLKPMRSDEKFERRVVISGTPMHESFQEMTEETRKKLAENPDYMKTK